MGMLLLLFLVAVVILGVADRVRTKVCPYCRRAADRKATKCPHCASPLEV